MSYQPDPPFQIYWPDEPPPVYRADPTAPSYFADAPPRDYYPDAAASDSGEESVIDSAIRNMPVYAPMVQPKPIAQQNSVGQQKSVSAQQEKKPVLSLVPPKSPQLSHSQPKWAGAIIDRRVTSIEIQHLLEILMEADDSDGYTRSEMEKELDEIERRVKIIRKRFRGTLLERVSRWMRPDQL
ncbi:hypothetical protein EON83_11255 [bacterium]|nr:MAG: hypothetical protein EON83_11255 [bacterium]